MPTCEMTLSSKAASYAARFQVPRQWLSSSLPAFIVASIASIVAASIGASYIVRIKPAETSPLHYTLTFTFRTSSPCFERLHDINTDDDDFAKRLRGA